MSKKFFFAYPSAPNAISHSIRPLESETGGRISIKTWEQTFGPGRFIDMSVMPEINNADGLIFELSVANNNVFFEAGYAIGLRKPILPVCNTSIKDAGLYLKTLGLFDNIGYSKYENSETLKSTLRTITPPDPLFQEQRGINLDQPFYILDAYRRSEFAAKITSAVKEAVTFFKSFDPQEEYRMSLRTVYDDVSESAGVIVSLLSDSKEDYLMHNLRASFIAGLSLGMSKECLILTDGEMQTPLDFRDNCKTVKHPNDILDYITAFGLRVHKKLQSHTKVEKVRRKDLLERVSIGSAAAENEFRNLEEYFVDTTEYKTALNGQGRLVIGRKGAGKTAIFWRVRDSVRSSPQALVVDLKPDGYQLRKFKEKLVKLLSEGTKEHTLTAFWEYLIYGEIINKILEDDHQLYGRDQEQTKKLDQLRSFRDKISEGREGDFSERMMSLLNQVSIRFSEQYGAKDDGLFLTTEQITDLIYKADLRQIQNVTIEYLSFKKRTLILVDNIDKGWGAYGVDKDDVLIVRALMDALRKIERQMGRKNTPFDWLLLLRNDVYELLVDDQNDRGKEDKIVVDWESKSGLREVIERRIEASTLNETGGQSAKWIDIAIPTIQNKSSLDWLVDRCLMRPRYLIQLVNQCLGQATSARHKLIQEDDLKEGYRLYSLDIIANTNFEMRDIYPPAHDAIYVLIGFNRLCLMEDIKLALMMNGYAENHISEIIRLFFWFGVLGAQTDSNAEKYIYDYRYDEKIFTRIRQTSLGDKEPVYINLAFSEGLDCKNS